MNPRSINWITDAELLDAPVTGVGTAKIYLLVKGRNAWHATWITRFRATNAIHLTLASAKLDAENQRVQGSTFTIREVPAIRLQTEGGSVLAIEFHPNNCFGKYRPVDGDDLLVGRPLRFAIRQLNGLYSAWTGPRISEHSFQQVYIADAEPESLSPRKPLANYASASYGGNYGLGWSRYKSDYSRRGINRIVRAQARRPAMDAGTSGLRGGAAVLMATG